MKVLICSGSDSRFYDLLHEMIRSVRDKPDSQGIDLGVLDLGLTIEQKAYLAPLVQRVAEPGWDMEFPPVPGGSTHQAYRGFKAMTARPFLPRYFPGYDVYVWIDADAWVQDWQAVDCLIKAAASGEIAIVPEIERAYRQQYARSNRRWMHDNYRRFFGDQAAQGLWHMPVLNSGIFALHRDAPHWQAWAEDFQAGLLRVGDLTIEQTALNYTVYGRRLPHHFLPARFNWLVNKALPKFDLGTGLFTEPLLPHLPLGIIHLSGEAKKSKHLIWTTDGSAQIGTKLRYSAARTRPDDQSTARPGLAAAAPAARRRGG
jgi:hypothetical protein